MDKACPEQLHHAAQGIVREASSQHRRCSIGVGDDEIGERPDEDFAIRRNPARQHLWQQVLDKLVSGYITQSLKAALSAHCMQNLGDVH